MPKDVNHPGACHLYVHATESTVVPGARRTCAEFLGSSIPGASHINHMPSHTWNEVGRWGDSVRANLEAWHSDQKAAIGEGFAIYPEHNLHMLLYAASMDGQGAIAMRAGKDYAKLTSDTSFQVLTLVRFGRFDEVLEVTNRPKPQIQGGLWDFAQGYAHLRQGETDFASLFSARSAHGRHLESDGPRAHREEPARNRRRASSKERLRAASGDLPKAIGAFESAVTLQESLTYDEPEPLPFHAAHWLGAALLEAKRYEDAERVYRKELEHHPHNGWSLLGCSRRWRPRARSRRRSTRTSPRAGRGPTPGSGARGSERDRHSQSISD